MRNETTVERVIRHEGFKPRPYIDSLGTKTIGHGLTYITVGESFAIVNKRLENLERIIASDNTWLNEYPQVLSVLTEMSFQMGLQGVMQFKRMWLALRKRDFKLAAIEMLDSKWSRQTPERAQYLAEIMRGNEKIPLVAKLKCE